MIRVRQLKLPIDHEESALLRLVESRLRLKEALSASSVDVFQRAVDARRGKPLKFSYTVDVSLDPALEDQCLERARSADVVRTPDMVYRFPEQHQFAPGASRPVIVGSGPCGLFACLLLAQLGLRPLLLERGKMAGPRARDVTRFWREGVFDSESNVQFGEGGAGTFSDGKLYTQIKDRDNRCRKILEELAAHGAPEDILVNARPHIGTDKLIKVLRHLRESIHRLGGEIRYESRVTDFNVNAGGALSGVVLSNGEVVPAEAAIFAVGHSARDVFEWMLKKEVPMEPKPFSVGVRIEHPQSLLDQTQYGKWAGHARLGSAAYRFVHHGKDRRSVYSFCMCPGGLVVGAASEEGRLVTNGMSSYARSESNANAGFMVEVHPDDLPADDALAGVRFQRELEEKAFALGGGDYRAPAQLLGDFMKDRPSEGPRSVKPSFRPGVVYTDLRRCLPEYVVRSLKEAVPRIAKQLPGFDHPDAVLTAVESRSSSPLRIQRGADFQCPSVPGLYPAGEGAGYAGGIISAAVDGLRVAEAVALRSVD